MQLEDHRKFPLENFYFNDLNKFNLEKIQLKKTSKLNQYLYESKGFNILRWNFKPEIIFLIIYGEKNISLETNENLETNIEPTIILTKNQMICQNSPLKGRSVTTL